MGPFRVRSLVGPYKAPKWNDKWDHTWDHKWDHKWDHIGRVA